MERSSPACLRDASSSSRASWSSRQPAGLFSTAAPQGAAVFLSDRKLRQTWGTHMCRWSTKKTLRHDLKHHAAVVCSATAGCAVEVAEIVEGQDAERIGAIGNHAIVQGDVIPGTRG